MKKPSCRINYLWALFPLLNLPIQHIPWSSLISSDLITVLSPHEVITQWQAGRGKHRFTRMSGYLPSQPFSWHLLCVNTLTHTHTHTPLQAVLMSSNARMDDRGAVLDEMGIAAGCAGHGLAVARCCVTRDYVRAESGSLQWAQEGWVPPPYTEGGRPHRRYTGAVLLQGVGLQCAANRSYYH